MKTSIFTFMFFVTTLVQAHPIDAKGNGTKPVLADLPSLKALKIPVLASDITSQVGFTYLTPAMENDLHRYSHLAGKCGAFKSLEGKSDLSIQNIESMFQSLNTMNKKNELYSKAPYRIASVVWNETIQKAIDNVSEVEIHNWVKWLSSFPNRYNRATDPNKHVQQLKDKLDALLKTSKLPATVSLIDHINTAQKSIRVTIAGSDRPNEIVVLGGHLDSINIMGGGTAPGADDNASGSANLLEALRIVLQQKQPSRTLEFFWYAGEESGLLGSAEIAEKYKSDKKNVIGVLQFDMTLFPGEGEFVIGNVTDFTSTWLQDYFFSINDTYLKVRIVPDICGYACSDHASWYQSGFSTVYPFEATSNTMNNNLHTPQDVIDSKSNFKHATIFSKIAVIFALDLANSNVQAPL